MTKCNQCRRYPRSTPLTAPEEQRASPADPFLRLPLPLIPWIYFAYSYLALMELRMNRLLVRRFLFSLFASVFALVAADTSSLSRPPAAKRAPKVTEINGLKLVDNYFWLRDKSNPR